MSGIDYLQQLPLDVRDLIHTESTYSPVFLPYIKYLESLFSSRPYFFPQYTDHSIPHSVSIVKDSWRYINDDSFKTAMNALFLSLVALCHDMGMHLTREMFCAYIQNNSKQYLAVSLYPDIPISELLSQFIEDSRHWTALDWKRNTGDESRITNSYPLDPNGFTEKHAMYFGEFIRRHHGRIAYELMLCGFPTIQGDLVKPFDLPEHHCHLIAILARSHTHSLRGTVCVLKEFFSGNAASPLGVDAVLIAALIRISDSLHLHLRSPFRFGKYSDLTSPLSADHHSFHKAIQGVDHSETTHRVHVQANPKCVKDYLNIAECLKVAQHEIDTSRSVLLEVYADKGDKNILKINSVVSNIESPNFLKHIEYVPKHFQLSFHPNMATIFAESLYPKTDTYSYAFREILQNAVDACRVAHYYRSYKGIEYPPSDYNIKVEFENSHLTISDNGIGMRICDIEDYFLRIGNSYSSSPEWKDISDRGIRSGLFGVGVSTGFALGHEISVKTKHIDDTHGYSFSLIGATCDIVNIEKSRENTQNGTQIKIQLSHKAEEYFKILNTQHIHPYGHIPATPLNWYGCTCPKVGYYIISEGTETKIENDTENVPSSISYGPENQRWESYEGKNIQVYWDIDSQSNVACYLNGFLVPYAWANKDIGIQNGYNVEIDRNSWSKTGIAFPFVAIEDYHNKFRINLMRDSMLDNVSLFKECEGLEEHIWRQVWIAIHGRRECSPLGDLDFSPTGKQRFRYLTHIDSASIRTPIRGQVIYGPKGYSLIDRIIEACELKEMKWVIVLFMAPFERYSRSLPKDRYVSFVELGGNNSLRSIYKVLREKRDVLRKLLTPYNKMTYPNKDLEYYERYSCSKWSYLIRANHMWESGTSEFNKINDDWYGTNSGNRRGMIGLYDSYYTDSVVAILELVLTKTDAIVSTNMEKWGDSNHVFIPYDIENRMKLKIVKDNYVLHENGILYAKRNYSPE